MKPLRGVLFFCTLVSMSNAGVALAKKAPLSRAVASEAIPADADHTFQCTALDRSLAFDHSHLIALGVKGIGNFSYRVEGLFDLQEGENPKNQKLERGVELTFGTKFKIKFVSKFKIGKVVEGGGDCGHVLRTTPSEVDVILIENNDEEFAKKKKVRCFETAHWQNNSC